MKYGNCLIWALYKKCKYGGRLIFTSSERLGFHIKDKYIPLLFHVIWESPTKKLWSYTPIKFLNKNSKGLNLIILYKGVPIKTLLKREK